MFSEQVAPLRAAAPSETRFVLVTATLPAEMFDELEGSFPGIGAALGPGLHRSAPGATISCLSTTIISCLPTAI